MPVPVSIWRSTKTSRGDHKGAIADWITLLKSAPADAAWAPEVRGVVVQVAKNTGATVWGQTSASEKADILKEAGADNVVVAADYRQRRR